MDWLEILIPLIILAVYFFGGLAGRKGAEEEEPDPRTMTPEEAQAQAERERVQAEIRERILERRRQAEAEFEEKRRQAAGGVTPPPPPQVASERQPPRTMNRPTNIPQAPAHPGRPERPADPSFSWEENRASQNPFAKEMEVRRRQIEETEKRVAALRSQHGLDKAARKPRVTEPLRSERAPRLGTSLNRNVRTLLAQPASVRTAIVLAEIIDKPVSLRTKDRRI
jgi:hypothetical protein